MMTPGCYPLKLHRQDGEWFHFDPILHAPGAILRNQRTGENMLCSETYDGSMDATCVRARGLGVVGPQNCYPGDRFLLLRQLVLR